jgi:hypothetical protein
VSRCTLRLAALAASLAGALMAGGVAAAATTRTFELATPLADHGQDLTNGVLSRDGGHIVGQSGGALGDSPSGLGTTLIAVRGESGWNTQVVNGGASMQALQWTPDFSRIFFSTGAALDPGDTDPSAADIYERDTDGSFNWLSQGFPMPNDDNTGVSFAGSSADGTHVIFMSTEVLDPAVAGKTAAREMVYERTGGVTRAVGLDSSGTLINVNGAVPGAGLTHGFGDTNQNLRNAISQDGSRIFFESPDPTLAGAKPEIYMRSNGQTTQVSAPQPGVVDPAGILAKRYEGATADGSKVFFTTAQQLTSDDTDSSSDLYQYDVASGTLTRLSTGASGTGAGVTGLVDYTDNGSTLYFLATGLLVPGNGVLGSPNLYVLRNGQIGFVTTLLAADSSPLAVGATASRLEDLTPDGNHLVFLTTAKLVPEDTDAKRDVYEYDATTGAVTLVSGGSGAVDAALRPNAFGASGLIRRGSVSDDGSDVIFQTTESLLPEDTNTVADVYERRDGVLSLLSSGTSAYASEALGLSADGRDALIRTRDTLSDDDDDGGAYDLYDARIGGGFPAAAAPAVPCSEDACQDPPTPAPVRPTSSTSTFFGPGNVTHKPPSMSVQWISAAARARFARTGRLTVTVKLGIPTSVTARVRANIGRGLQTVASAHRTARRPETIHLQVQLSKTARLALRRHKRLAVRVEVRRAGVASPQTTSMTLRLPK